MRVGPLLGKVSWPLLLPISWGYGRVVAVRNRLYRSGRFPTRKAPCPVVSIGNLVAGGTGKTPMAQLLASHLSEKGKVAVLARGYKGQAERRTVPTLVTPEVSWEVAGDEPYLIAQRVPSAIVVSGASRWASAQLATAKGAELILLDDGMQHRSLSRDLELVLIDGRDPFGGGGYLPAGRLRESPSQLERADLVVVTRPAENRMALEHRLAALTNAPIVWMEPQVRAVVDLRGRPLSRLQGIKVGLFCGIAKPEGFVQTVRRLGCQVVGTRAVPDHRVPTSEQLLSLANKVYHRGGELLLCTEKDWVKLGSDLDLPLPIGVVQIELAVTQNEEAWNAFLAKCENLIATSRI